MFPKRGDRGGVCFFKFLTTPIMLNSADEIQEFTVFYNETCMVVTSKWQQKKKLKIRQNLFSNKDFRYHPCACRSLSFFFSSSFVCLFPQLIQYNHTCYWKSDIATEEVLLTMQAELALAVLSPVESLRSLSQPGEADGFTLQGLTLERSEEIIAKHKVTNPNHQARCK